MSIQYLIDAWVATPGGLCLMQPALQSTKRERVVFASPEVVSALLGPWENADIENRMGRARAQVDTFIAGTRMSVRMPPSRSARAQIALLDPSQKEVWEIRARDPRPGVRIFGRFSEKDHFLALTIALREEFENNWDFSPMIEKCRRSWRMYFNNFPPHTGTLPNDYVSKSFPV